MRGGKLKRNDGELSSYELFTSLWKMAGEDCLDVGLDVGRDDGRELCNSLLLNDGVDARDATRDCARDPFTLWTGVPLAVEGTDGSLRASWILLGSPKRESKVQSKLSCCDSSLTAW